MASHIDRKLLACWLLVFVLHPSTGSGLQDALTSVTSIQCDDEVQQIACYYDSTNSAIVGVQYTLRNSRAKRKLCSTSGQPGDTVRLRRGVGITRILVRRSAAKVLSLDFRLSDGKTSSCRVAAIKSAISDGISASIVTEGGTIVRGAPGTAATSATTASSSSLASSNAIRDFLTRYPYTIPRNANCTRADCSATSNRPPWPTPSPPPISIRGRLYVSPTAHVLGGLTGVCTSSGALKNRLEAVTKPCWVKAVTTPVSPPSPKPPIVTPPPNPKPPPKPSPSLPPPLSPNGYLDVTLYSRAQAGCGALGSDVSQGLMGYLNVQLVLLGQGGYHTKQDVTDCACRIVQGVPMYTCKYTVKGPSSEQWDAAAAATYVAASITAAGQQICSGAAAAAGNFLSFCQSSVQITGLCAAASRSSSGSALSCNLPATPPAWPMAVSLGVPGAACDTTVQITSAGANSLTQYLSGFLPGYSVAIPGLAASPLTCTSTLGNAYYQVSAVNITPGSQLDVHGAAEFLAATLNQQQPGPCNPSSSTSSSRPAFCSDLLQPPVICGAASYSATDAPVSCSG